MVRPYRSASGSLFVRTFLAGVISLEAVDWLGALATAALSELHTIHTLKGALSLVLSGIAGALRKLADARNGVELTEKAFGNRNVRLPTVAELSGHKCRGTLY